MNLVDNHSLEKMPVVANCRMNRERELTGSNGYEKELGLKPVDYILNTRSGRWLDLCCGSGRALTQAANHLLECDAGASIVGVDLVGMFWTHSLLPNLQLVESSVLDFKPAGRFDLITCVHGLHYIGDKLQLLEKVASWLTPSTGLFVANFDINSLIREGQEETDEFRVALHQAGFELNKRNKRLTRLGYAKIQFNYTFAGADPEAGPNYTGQPAVHSHYHEN